MGYPTEDPHPAPENYPEVTVEAKEANLSNLVHSNPQIPLVNPFHPDLIWVQLSAIIASHRPYKFWAMVRLMARVLRYSKTAMAARRPHPCRPTVPPQPPLGTPQPPLDTPRPQRDTPRPQRDTFPALPLMFQPLPLTYQQLPLTYPLLPLMYLVPQVTRI